MLSLLSVITALGLHSPGVMAADTGGDTSGCGKSHAGNETQAWSLMSSGMNRTYYVHVPQNYSSNDQHPAIVGFHGRGGTGLYFAADTRLSEAQFTGDSIMVYPDGVDRTWAGASYSAVSVEQDLQFVWDVLAKVRSDYCVNSARLYATGHSNGGGLVNLIACNATVGAEFAAFAPVSGAFYENQYDGSGCKPARNVMPMLEIHGVEDQVISYKGGKGRGGELPSITDWLSGWAKRDGCEDETTAKISGGQVEHLTWQCRGRNGTLQHYRVNKGKHAWASEDPNLSQDQYNDPKVPINASTVVPQFLRQFERPPENEDLNGSSKGDAKDSGSPSLIITWVEVAIGLCAAFAVAV